MLVDARQANCQAAVNKCTYIARYIYAAWLYACACACAIYIILKSL
jgi:hypothetical protein